MILLPFVVSNLATNALLFSRLSEMQNDESHLCGSKHAGAVAVSRLQQCRRKRLVAEDPFIEFATSHGSRRLGQIHLRQFGFGESGVE